MSVPKFNLFRGGLAYRADLDRYILAESLTDVGVDPLQPTDPRRRRGRPSGTRPLWPRYAVSHDPDYDAGESRPRRPRTNFVPPQS